jgi:nitrite reductase/ring-hydroxylating ferredoxin subunit
VIPPSLIDDRSTAAPTAPTRRSVLRGAALAGLVAPVLTACGGGEAASDTASPSAAASGPGSATPEASPSPSPTGITTASVAPGQAVLVETGGATVILAQPVAGTFKAYDTRCTHQGCKVAPASGLALACPCHGSRFDATTGAVTNGPAKDPLTERAVTVEGDQITIA